MKTTEQRESRLRRQFHSKGYRLQKSRIRNPHLNNRGGYQIILTDRNMVIHGVDYELTLEDLEDIITWIK